MIVERPVTHNLDTTYVDEDGVKWGPWINILRTIPHRNSIPLTRVSFDLFNKYAKTVMIRNEHGFFEYGEFVMTKTNNISKKSPRNVNSFKMNVSHNNTYVELIINDERGSAILQFTNTELSTKNGATIIKRKGGAANLRILIKEFKAEGINLESYAIEEHYGRTLHEIDKEENPRLIKVIDESAIDETLENCHHLDLNSAYAGGIAHHFPELKPTLERIYRARHEFPEYKDVLNLSIGAMESPYMKYRFKHLAMKAHEYTNMKLNEMYLLLVESGRRPLLFNTDGIWYQGDLLDLNSTELGEWKTNHKHCTLRIKSRGAYEYIEDGKYQPVLRGYTTLDRVKPRTEWQWGDIYSNEANEYQVIRVRDEIDDKLGLERIATKENILDEKKKTIPNN